MIDGHLDKKNMRLINKFIDQSNPISNTLNTTIYTEFFDENDNVLPFQGKYFFLLNLPIEEYLGSCSVKTINNILYGYNNIPIQDWAKLVSKKSNQKYNLLDFHCYTDIKSSYCSIYVQFKLKNNIID